MSIAIDPPSPAQAPPSIDQLLAALPDRIEPVRRTWGYRLRLLLVLGVLCVLLLVHLALVVVLSYGLWVHLTPIWVSKSVHTLIPDDALYVGFCVAGPILAVFLIKPIFTMWGRTGQGVRVSRASEPELFAFVERLCRAQRAPVPREIRVNTECNAAAGLRHGLISLFRNDLVLVIGLPLARSLTLRQLTGVMAHEFGHFAQGGAIRLSYLAKRMVEFLYRIAHERDGFDEMLIEASRFRIILDIRVTVALALFSLFMWAVRGLLGLARLLMRGLAWLGLAASASLTREMEFDADRHEARIAGSTTFAEVSDALNLLNAASQAAHGLRNRWAGARRLVDDVPGLIEMIRGRIEATPETVEAIRKTASERVTGRFDTHPSDRDRIAQVLREGEPGAFQVDAPTSVLFRDLPALCREVTLQEHRDLLSFEFKAFVIVPLSELMPDPREQTEEEASLARSTQHAGIEARRLKFRRPASTQEPIDEAAELASLEDARRRIVEHGPKARELALRLAELHEQQAVAAIHLEVARANGRFINDSSAVAPATEERRRINVEIQEAFDAFEPFARAMVDRRASAERLATIPHVAEALRSESAGETRSPGILDDALDALDAGKDRREMLRIRARLLRDLATEMNRQPGCEFLSARLEDVGMELKDHLKALRASFDSAPYPFEVGTPLTGNSPGFVTIASQLGPVAPLLEIPIVHNRAVDYYQATLELETRILATIARRVERIEAALGLPPLPDPA